METIKVFLRNLATTSGSQNNLFKRTLLKEYLQVVVLDYLYSHKNTDLDAGSVRLDLEQFIEDERFPGNLGKNIKEILLREVKDKL